MRGFPQGSSKPRRSKVATKEGTLAMSNSPKVNMVRVVKEVVIKLKAGVRINPGPHLDGSPPSLIPEQCGLVLSLQRNHHQLPLLADDVCIYDFSIQKFIS